MTINYQQVSFLFFLFLLFYFWNLEYRPTYNPFDEEDNISIETLLDDGCELLSAPCGYGTYGKEVDGNLVYYQFNPGEVHKVSAKGICIHIDSTEIEPTLKPLMNKRGRIFIEKLLSEKIDRAKLIEPLLKFGVQNISQEKAGSDLIQMAVEEGMYTGINHMERLWCFVDKNNQIHTAKIDFKVGTDINNQRIIIRTLELFISQKRKNKSPLIDTLQ